MLIASLKRELVTLFRQPADALNPLVFFMIVVSLFPIGVGPSAETLSLIAPGVIWVAALLATILSMESIFRADFDDGSLEQMVLSNQPLILLVSGKCLGHWLATGLPLVLMSPILGITMSLDSEAILAVMISLLLGTPVLTLVGAIGASITVGIRKGGVLLALLILPLYIPVLILGTNLIQTAQFGGSYDGHMLWLGAALVLSLGLAPVATAFGIRVSLS